MFVYQTTYVPTFVSSSESSETRYSSFGTYYANSTRSITTKSTINGLTDYSTNATGGLSYSFEIETNYSLSDTLSATGTYTYTTTATTETPTSTSTSTTTFSETVFSTSYQASTVIRNGTGSSFTATSSSSSTNTANSGSGQTTSSGSGTVGTFGHPTYVSTTETYAVTYLAAGTSSGTYDIWGITTTLDFGLLTTIWDTAVTIGTATYTTTQETSDVWTRTVTATSTSFVTHASASSTGYVTLVNIVDAGNSEILYKITATDSTADFAANIGQSFTRTTDTLDLFGADTILDVYSRTVQTITYSTITTTGTTYTNLTTTNLTVTVATANYAVFPHGTGTQLMAANTTSSFATSRWTSRTTSNVFSGLTTSVSAFAGHMNAVTAEMKINTAASATAAATVHFTFTNLYTYTVVSGLEFVTTSSGSGSGTTTASAAGSQTTISYSENDAGATRNEATWPSCSWTLFGGSRSAVRHIPFYGWKNPAAIGSADAIGLQLSCSPSLYYPYLGGLVNVFPNFIQSPELFVRNTTWASYGGGSTTAYTGKWDTGSSVLLVTSAVRSSYTTTYTYLSSTSTYTDTTTRTSTTGTGANTHTFALVSTQTNFYADATSNASARNGGIPEQASWADSIIDWPGLFAVTDVSAGGSVSSTYTRTAPGTHSDSTAAHAIPPTALAKPYTLATSTEVSAAINTGRSEQIVSFSKYPTA
jgi:hypothetical protein